MDLGAIFSHRGDPGETLQALEEERKKIEVFHRELPFSLLLINHAIEIFQKQKTPTIMEEEPISDGAPHLEEFIPLKLSSTEEEVKKKDWMKSAQLWTGSPEEEGREKMVSFGKRREEREEMAAASSTSETRGEEKVAMSQRKARRCWSQELHRRFLDALQQLGGTEVATPKRIREIMKEDGLTNDEVKSHLQKYRLHSRRPTHALQPQNKTSASLPVAFMGGVWFPGYGS